jgi:hypothetical protein
MARSEVCAIDTITAARRHGDEFFQDEPFVSGDLLSPRAQPSAEQREQF